MDGIKLKSCTLKNASISMQVSSCALITPADQVKSAPICKFPTATPAFTGCIADLMLFIIRHCYFHGCLT